MKTNNETYVKRNERESKSISSKMNSSKSSSKSITGFDAKIISAFGTRNGRKIIASNAQMQLIGIRLNVRSLTSKVAIPFALIRSTVSDVSSTLRGGKFEPRERKMKDVLRNTLKYALSASIVLSVALAQGTPKLDIRIEDQKYNMSEVEKKDAKRVSYAPGDTIRYVISASNKGDGLMKHPVIVDPVPVGVTYVIESASGADTEIAFSMDQGSTYSAWPPYYSVRNSKGILVKRKATADMITHIRWSVLKDLQPGETTSMEFLAEVEK